MSVFVRIANISAAFLFTATSVLAEERFSEVEILPDEVTSKVQSDPYAKLTEKLIDGGLIEQAIISGSRVWNPGQPIRVCFFGGSKTLRKKIAAIASEWENVGASINIDFGNDRNPNLCQRGFYNIRVGYNKRGYWSYVGQDSISQASQNEQSLNLANFDNYPPNDTEFRRVVLHEFGHALGFQHEHQNPSNSCESEFNFSAIYTYLGGPPNNWSKSTVDSNMRSISYHDGDIATNFDRLSIMLYSFPARFYKAGTASRCFSQLNTKLSNGDVNGLIEAYGHGRSSQPEDVAAVEKASESLSDAEQTVVASRLAVLSADNEGKEEIIGAVRDDLVDVDLFRCKGGSSRSMADQVREVVSDTPFIGRRRVRSLLYPGSEALNPGINLIVDKAHAEMKEANRLLVELERQFPEKVHVIDNGGSLTPWLVSVATCE